MRRQAYDIHHLAHLYLHLRGAPHRDCGVGDQDAGESGERGMSEEQQVWERQEGEDNLWYDRFFRFLQMGPSRSIRAVYLAETPRNAERRQDSGIPRNWYEIADQWRWKERAEAWDEYRRKAVFTQGNAYDLNRIERLDKLADMLQERVTLMITQLPKKPKKPWFNHYLYEKYLQTLEALAAETGGRVKKNETTLTLPPEVYKGIGPNDEGSEP